MHKCPSLRLDKPEEKKKKKKKKQQTEIVYLTDLLFYIFIMQNIFWIL